MPVTYVIDQARGLIRTRCAGTVALKDVLAHFDALARDPARPERPDVLLDFTSLATQPTAHQVASVADRVTWRPGFNFGRCAIVADRDLTFGIARMFQAMAGEHFRAIDVFRDPAEAERWLERPPCIMPVRP